MLIILLKNMERGNEVKKKALKYDIFTRIPDSIFKFDFSTGEFLLPIIHSKKTPLLLLKKLFDGKSSFLLKSVNVEKMEKKFYVLVVKGKKQNN